VLVGLGRFVASQLRKPSGLVGRILARVLNRGNAPMNDLTVKSLDLTPDDHVLEVGFGGGDLINRMAPLVTRGRIVGVDFSPEMTSMCTKRFGALIRTGTLELRCASVENLPFASGAFTKACTVNTIYFWPDPVASLKELWRALREKGRLVVCFNPRATAEKFPYTKYGFELYEPAQVEHLLEEAGFRDVQMVPGSTRAGPFVCAVCTK
jgi:ubiquinone/menaquinone biosynthesis C-methylase UbiE